MGCQATCFKDGLLPGGAHPLLVAGAADFSRLRFVDNLRHSGREVALTYHPVFHDRGAHFVGDLGKRYEIPYEINCRISQVNAGARRWVRKRLNSRTRKRIEHCSNPKEA